MAGHGRGGKEEWAGQGMRGEEGEEGERLRR